MIPAIIITRDRVTYAKRCLESLSKYRDLDPIIIVDHGSAYGPMLEWLYGDVIDISYLRGDFNARQLWEWPMLSEIVGTKTPYLVTDCDIVIDDDCPDDWLYQLHRVLSSSLNLVKAGLSLRLDDLPETPLAQAAKNWEAQWNFPIGWELEQHTGFPTVRRTSLDTTLALYVPLEQHAAFSLNRAARLQAPYQARHLPWYETEETEELKYYREHVLLGASFWVERSKEMGIQL